jgi:hypothetical protein
MTEDSLDPAELRWRFPGEDAQLYFGHLFHICTEFLLEKDKLLRGAAGTQTFKANCLHGTCAA